MQFLRLLRAPANAPLLDGLQVSVSWLSVKLTRVVRSANGRATLPNGPQQRPRATGVNCKHGGLARSAACGGYPFVLRIFITMGRFWSTLTFSIGTNPSL